MGELMKQEKFQAFYDNLKLPEKVVGFGNPKGWIAQIIKDMAIGNIDVTLHRVLSRLRYDGYTEEEAKLFVEPHAIAAGATPRHIDEKIRNVWKRYDVGPAKQENGVMRFAGPEIFKDIKKTEWLVEGLIPKITLSMIVGDERTRKGWFALDLALSVATGTPVLGRFPCQKGVVINLQLEDPLSVVGVRYNKLVGGRDQVPDASNFYNYVSDFRFDDDDQYRSFIEFCDKVRPVLILIDTFAHCTSLNIKEQVDAVKLIRRFYEVRARFNCAILVVHHLTKHSIGTKQTPIGARPVGAAFDVQMHVKDVLEEGISSVYVKTKHIENFGFDFRLVDGRTKDGEATVRVVEA